MIEDMKPIFQIYAKNVQHGTNQLRSKISKAVVMLSACSAKKILGNKKAP